MQLYQARLSDRVVGVLAYDKEMARQTVEELYPDLALLQLSLAPEWFSEDDADQLA